MPAISTRTPPVAVAYDTNGGRRFKQFEDANVAKRFFTNMDRQGRHPAVRPFDKGEPVMAKTKSTKTTKTTSTKPAAEKKEAPDRDKLGCRVGSQAATINACVTGKAKEASVIAKEADLPLARVRSHLKFLVAKGAVAESDAGFALKK
jgi:preprotein translocase subunit SecD